MNRFGKSLNNYSKYASFETSFNSLLSDTLTERFTNSDIFTPTSSGSNFNYQTVGSSFNNIESFTNLINNTTTQFVKANVNYQIGSPFGTNPGRGPVMSRDGKHICIPAFYNNLFYSNDYGSSWKTIVSGLTNNDSLTTRRFNSAYVSDNASLIVYNTTSNSYYSGKLAFSTNQGNTWTESTPNPGSIELITAYPSNIVGSDNGSVLYGGGNKIVKSIDRGQTWQIITDNPGLPNAGLSEGTVLNMACSSNGSFIIFFRRNGSGFGRPWLSRDGGQTWIGTSHPRTYIQGISCSSDGRTIVTSCGDEGANVTIYISTDNGNTWTPNKGPREWRSRGEAIALSGDGSTVVFGVTNDFGGTMGVYLSKDLCKTWALIPGIQQNPVSLAISNNGNVIIACTSFPSIDTTKNGIVYMYNSTSSTPAAPTPSACLNEEKLLEDNNRLKALVDANAATITASAADKIQLNELRQTNAQLRALTDANTATISAETIKLNELRQTNAQLKALTDASAADKFQLSEVNQTNAQLKALVNANALIISEDKMQLNEVRQTNAQLKALIDSNAKIIAETNAKLLVMSETNEQLKAMSEANDKLKATNDEKLRTMSDAKLLAISEANEKLRAVSEANEKLRAMNEANEKLRAMSEAESIQIQPTPTPIPTPTPKPVIPTIRKLCPSSSQWKYTDIQYIIGPATDNKPYPECDKAINTAATKYFKTNNTNLIFPPRTLPNGLTYTQCNPFSLSNLQTTADAWGPENTLVSIPSNCNTRKMTYKLSPKSLRPKSLSAKSLKTKMTAATLKSSIARPSSPASPASPASAASAASASSAATPVPSSQLILPPPDSLINNKDIQLNKNGPSWSQYVIKALLIPLNLTLGEQLAVGRNKIPVNVSSSIELYDSNKYYYLGNLVSFQGLTYINLSYPDPRGIDYSRSFNDPPLVNKFVWKKVNIQKRKVPKRRTK